MNTRPRHSETPFSAFSEVKGTPEQNFGIGLRVKLLNRVEHNLAIILSFI